MLIMACQNKASEPSQALSKQDLLRVGFDQNGIDIPTLENLLEKADLIEYIFYDIAGSLNQVGPDAIRNDLSLISTEKIKTVPAQCKPFARKVYQGKGVILLEADLYFSAPCFFQIFIKNEKALYGNGITEPAYGFYTDLINQVDKAVLNN